MPSPCPAHLPNLRPKALADTPNVQRLLGVGLTCAQEKTTETKRTPSLLTCSSHPPCGCAMPINVASLPLQTKVSVLKSAGNQQEALLGHEPVFIVRCTRFNIRRNPGALPDRRVGTHCPPSADTDKLLLSKTTAGGLVAVRLILRSVTIAGADARPGASHGSAKDSKKP